MGYDVGLLELSSVSERWSRLLHEMGLAGEFAQFVSSNLLRDNSGSDTGILRSKPWSSVDRNLCPCNDNSGSDCYLL